MANAYHTGNHTPTLICVENDGQTLVNIEANLSTHALATSAGSTGTNNGPTISRHDESHVSTLLAVSNVDGKTPVVVYGDSSGNLLIEST